MNDFNEIDIDLPFDSPLLKKFNEGTHVDCPARSASPKEMKEMEAVELKDDSPRPSIDRIIKESTESPFASPAGERKEVSNDETMMQHSNVGRQAPTESPAPLSSTLQNRTFSEVLKESEFSPIMRMDSFEMDQNEDEFEVIQRSSSAAEVEAYPTIQQAGSQRDESQVATPQPLTPSSSYILPSNQANGKNLGDFLRVTKQKLMERIGKAKPSEESPFFFEKLQQLEDMGRRYENTIALFTRMYCDFTKYNDTVKVLGDHMTTLGLGTVDYESPERILMNKTGEGLAEVNQVGDRFAAVLKNLTHQFETFRSKAIEDTLETSRKFDKARINYDAYLQKVRVLEEAEERASSGSSTLNLRTKQRLIEARRDLELYTSKYVEAKKVLVEKIEMLLDKRSADLKNQLENLQSALISYYLDSANYLMDSARTSK